MADEPGWPGAGGQAQDAASPGQRSPNRQGEKPTMQLFQPGGQRQRPASGRGASPAGRATGSPAGRGYGWAAPSSRGRAPGSLVSKLRGSGELVRRASLTAGRPVGSAGSPSKAAGGSARQSGEQAPAQPSQQGSATPSNAGAAAQGQAPAAAFRTPQPTGADLPPGLGGSAFGKPAPAFGAPATASGSGSGGGGFGGGSGAFSSSFGRSSGAFGGGDGGAFGAAAAPAASPGGAFGTPAAAPQPEQQPATGSGAFGSAASPGGAFGSAASPAQGGVFARLGQQPAATPATTGASGGGGFGSSPPLTPFSEQRPAFGAAAAATPAAATPAFGSAFRGGGLGAAAAGQDPGVADENAGGQPASAGLFGKAAGENKAEALQRRAARFGPADEAPQPAAAAAAEQPARSPMTDVPSTDDGEGEGPRGTIEGTCTLMCPEAERAFRERMRDVDSFERPTEGGPPVLAVKKFARNVEQTAGNFRTLPTLQRTQAHLLAVMDRTDVPLAKIHHFLWDRLRGVRQDLFVQGYEDGAAIAMYEEHVRFMIAAEHELCGYTGDNFNSHLNLEQINKACISLNAMYGQARSEGAPAPNEGEFRAYHLLLLMGTHGKYRYNSTEFRKALKDCEPVREHPDLRRALELSRLLAAGAWASFLRTALASRYLVAALANLYFPALRAHALTVTARACKPQALSLQAFAAMLQLDSPEQAEAICAALELNVVQSGQGVAIELERKAYAAKAVPLLRSARISAKAAQPRSADVSIATEPAFWDPAAPAPELPDAQAAQQARAERQEQRRAAEAERQRQQAAWEQQQAAEAAACRAAEAQRHAEEQARLEAAEQQAAQQRRLEAERQRAAAAKEAELQRQRREQEEREAAARRRAEAEAAAAKAAAEAAERRRREAAERAAAEAERKRREEQRLAAEAAERRRWEVEAAARAREARIQRNRAAATQLLARLGRTFRSRAALLHWRQLAADARRERQRKEAVRLANLAGCRIGPPRRPELRAKGPQPPRSPPLPQASPPRLLPPDTGLDLAPALAGAVQAACRTGAAVPAKLHLKLCLLRSPEAGPAADWLSSALLGARRPDSSSPPVALRTIEAVTAGGETHVLRAAVRDVSAEAAAGTVPAAEAAGTGAILLWVGEADEPQRVSGLLRALLRALPDAPSQGPALLALVASAALAGPIKAWLAAEAGSALGKRLGRTRVAAVEQPGEAGLQAALLAGLSWAASNAPPPPPLTARLLGQLVSECLAPSLARLATHWTAGPQHFVAAYNAALAAARAELQAAARLAAGRGGWPPADCVPAAAASPLPPGWEGGRAQDAALRLLQRAQLPAFSAQPGTDADATVRQFLEQAGTPLPTSAAAHVPWRQALPQAFSLRLAPLDSCTAVALLAREQPAAAPLPTTPPPQQAPALDAPKRKTPLAEAGQLPAAKQRRTAGAGSPTKAAGRQRREEPAGEEGPAASELQREAEAHTAWIRGMLQAAELSSGSSSAREVPAGEWSVELEVAEGLRFRRSLRKLSGGF